MTRRRTAAKRRTRGKRTLSIDIGGSGIKAMVLDARGKPLGERVRVETPKPATPKRVLKAIEKLIEPVGTFERVSVGFPGVVIDGVTVTAPNLGTGWRNFKLARVLSQALRRPVRVINDAGMQGYGVTDGRGLEMVLTLGTGMGCALFIDGKYVPNLELAHHPFAHGSTYEDWVSEKALARVGKRRWNRRVREVVAQITPIWNPRQIYLGGGNAKHIVGKLSPHIKVVTNLAGILGGFALWQHQE